MSFRATFNPEKWIMSHQITNKTTHETSILQTDITLIRNLKNRENVLRILKSEGWKEHQEKGKLYSYVLEQRLVEESQSDSESDEQENIIQPIQREKMIIPRSNIKTSHQTSELFDIDTYKQSYMKQLLFIDDNDSYDLSNCFNSALAIYTDTAIYRDLPLKIVEEFEEDIEWEAIREQQSPSEKAEFTKPFITHLNPKSRTFVTSITDNGSYDLTYGLLMMSNIAKKKNYTYLVSLNNDSNKVKSIFDMLNLPTKNIIIINNETIKAIISDMKSRNLIIPTKASNDIIQLRDYQAEYIEYMNNHRKAIFKLPCGMGKSLIMIYHMMTHGKYSCILVPNIALVDQFYINIQRVYNGFNHELPEIHRLSTNYKEFEIIEPEKQQIVISVYNSFVQYFVEPLKNKKNKFEPSDVRSKNRFVCMYIDEAHHIIMPSNKRTKATMTQLMEQFDQLEIKARETEFKKNNIDRLDLEQEEKKVNVEPIELADLLSNNSQLKTAFSNLIYLYCNTYSQYIYCFSATIEPANYSKYNMFSAIQDGYLCRLNIDFIVDDTFGFQMTDETSTDLTPRQLAKLKRENEDKLLQRKISNFVSYIDKTEYKSIIVYTSRVRTARMIAKKLRSSAVVSCSSPTSERMKMFKDFTEHRLRTLLTVNCISEGVDLPNADTAIFFDDKHSIVNIIQCVGRVMRLCPDKMSATLAIPAYSDEDLEELYKNVLSLINGELGYGNADLRRIVSVKFNSSERITPNFEIIKKHVLRKVFEYNENYFTEISVYNKLRMCQYFWYICRMIPSVELVDIKEFYTPEGWIMPIYQFVKDNLWLDNLAGRELRKLYEIEIDEDK